jgi:hypothetical protein
MIYAPDIYKNLKRKRKVGVVPATVYDYGRTLYENLRVENPGGVSQCNILIVLFSGSSSKIRGVISKKKISTEPGFFTIYDYYKVII